MPMTANTALLEPLVALVAWSMAMWLWMYATRVPAILAMKMKLDPDAPSGAQMATLPARVRWKADNYNHLMEQPTIFYALVLALAVMGNTTEINLVLAWAYVGLRVMHSLAQALGNKIELRFALFVLSNIPLFGLTYGAASQLLSA
jgi:hypothetical protein